MEKIRVHIVEDQIILREGLKLLLGEMKGVEVFGESPDGEQFLAFLETHTPDVVLMDIHMPVMDGVEATKLAMQKYPDIKVLVLSTFDDDDHLLKMMEAGIRGYMLKSADEDELRKGIIRVHEGKNYFSSELSQSLSEKLDKRHPKNDKEDGLFSPITEREKEILRYICTGMTDKEIAALCNISIRTAGGHRGTLLEKTGCKNTASLISFAFRTGLFKP